MRHLTSLLVTLLVTAAAAAPAAADPRPPFEHRGQFMTDADGRVFVVHGLNVVQKFPPYYPLAVGFDDDDADFLAANGFNSVRLGVIHKPLELQPGRYDDGYLAELARTETMLAKRGIYTLLDFHQDMYNERFEGQGEPDWAVQDDGLPAEPKRGFPQNYFVMTALQRAFDHFWANDPGPGGVGLQDRYAAAWRHVARRFRDRPNVFGYDLLNEPWPGTTWQQCANPEGCPVFDAKLHAFNERMIRAIRRVDPTTLVFYEPNVLFNNGARTNLGDSADGNLGMSFHDYCLFAAEGGGGNTGCEELDSRVFDNADAHSRKTG